MIEDKETITKDVNDIFSDTAILKLVTMKKEKVSYQIH